MLRPNISKAAVERILRHRQPKGKVVLIGLRGYYLDSQGRVGTNDRGIYDDAGILAEWKDDYNVIHYATYNFNTDPSKYRAKTPTRKGMATLRTGNWLYKIGLHKGYKALVQAASVTVDRDGDPKPDTGWFGINIHRGGRFTTSSEGCQTVYQPQWDSFIQDVEQALNKSKQKTIEYLLLNETDRRKYIEGQ